jgi:hypothetical protein
MKICIEKTEGGQIMVGTANDEVVMDAVGGSQDSTKYDMEPVESLDAAFERARQLLSDDPMGEADAAGDAQFEKGFEGAGGAGLRGGM